MSKGIIIISLIGIALFCIAAGFLIGYQCARYKYETNHLGIPKNKHMKL